MGLGEKDSHTWSFLKAQATLGTSQAPAPALNAYTEAQLIQELGITKRRAQEWRYKGHGPKYIRQGRTILYLVEDVQDWLQQQKRCGGAQSERTFAEELDRAAEKVLENFPKLSAQKKAELAMLLAPSNGGER